MERGQGVGRRKGSSQYLANFNLSALARQPYENESAYWLNILRAAYANGQNSKLLAVREMGKTLFESSGYADRNRNNHWYVYDLYKTYLMREPDAPGWAWWENECNNYGRDNVRRAFDESIEFGNIVATLTPNGSASSTVSSFASARVDPFNQPGNGLTSRDTDWSVPLLSLPGRAGLDLGVSLSYSSMVWTRSGPYIYFDEDNGWPSPGFRLGFPTIQEKVFDAQAGDNVYLLIAGSRVSLRQVGTSNVYEAADSSYLQLIDSGGSLLVRATDGTQLSYSRFNNEWHCTQIKDRNGNYITVNYDWLGHITTITDTLNRTITFNYDTNNNLLSITQSRVGEAQPHPWATFGWATKTLSPSFSGVMVVGAPGPSGIPVLSQVGLDDGSRYTFEYNATGQVNPIRSYRSDNVERTYTAYDYDSPAADCPRLSETHTWAQNWTGINGVPQEVATVYSDAGNGSHTVTAPDGTVYKEFYGTGWQRGLITHTEVWSADGVKQKWTSNNRTQDNTAVNYQTNPRVTETNVFDASGNRRRTTVSYAPFGLPGGASCNLPSDTREYAGDAGTILRHTHTDYRMDPILDAVYLDRHIIGLVKEQSIFEVEVNGGTETLMSKVGFQYDETGSIQGTDAPVGHDSSYDGNFMTGRANLSSVKRYDVINSGQSTVSSVQYNTAGAVISTKDPLNHEVTVSYTDSFSANGTHLDAPRSFSTLAFPTTVTDADGHSSYIRYSYDFGAKTRVQGPPPNNQPQGLIQIFAYDGAGRIDRVTTTNNGAYRRFVYGPNYVLTHSTVNNIADEAYSSTFFDGAGRVFATSSNHPGSAGGYSARHTVYDLMGRVVKQSNPAETTGSWIPSGDDAAGWFYTEQTYDWQGRPRITTNTDGTTKEASYSGCGCAGGEVVTLTDEGTMDAGVFKRRQQKIYSDVLGRTVKTELLNWQGGSVYSTTMNNYNARDQVTKAGQYQGDEFSGVSQETTITYDGSGRPKTRHAPEQQVDPNNSSSTDHTTWDYNADDTIQKVTDARGASQEFTYNARHLLTTITYSAPSGIASTAPVSFSYDSVGHRTSMTDGTGNVSYQYNSLSQMTAETRTFAGLSGSFALTYTYTLSGQLKSLTDPFGARVDYAHDQIGRLADVSGTAFAGVTQYASSAQYRAWGAVKSLAYGNTKSLAVTYNSKLQAANYEVPGLLKRNYEYNDDGRLRFTQDQLTVNSKLDRSYEYDHLGRVTKALSGAEARGQGATEDRPYNETLAYDAMNHLTSRETYYWDRHDASGLETYVDNRRAGWHYDADGRLISGSTGQYFYDAAGRAVSFGDQDPYMTDQQFDSDGRRTKSVQRRFDEETSLWVTEKVTYYMISSVLGGALVSELDAQGAKERTQVYAGGRVLASQTVIGGVQSLQWDHRDASGAAFRGTDTAGQWIDAAEMDALGANAGVIKPLVLTPPPDKIGLIVPYPEIASMLTHPGGACIADKMPIPCDWLTANNSSVCPNGDCSPEAFYNPKTKRHELTPVRTNPNNGQLGFWPDGFDGVGFTFGADGRRITVYGERTGCSGG